MPLQEEHKSSTPLKNVKSNLFPVFNNRKRKATSPIPPANEPKAIKICDKESVDIQALVITEKSEVLTSESKENLDSNTLKSELIPSINVISENGVVLVPSECDELIDSDDSLKASSEDLNSSILNSSINGLNTSGISDKSGKEKTDMSVTVEGNKSESQNDGDTDKKRNSKKRKRMTPEEAKKRAEEREKKQLEKDLKKQELEKKKLEREQELKQKKIQKEMEKKAKEEERKEKERLRLEKKAQEEKEKQLKLEEKEAQKRIRQMELEAKLELKKLKEEQKIKQEEEKKKAEEEKKKAELEKEQKEKEKKERAKAAFVKFFRKENTSPIQVTHPIQNSIEQRSIFKPFQISEDMTLAPVVPLISQEKFNQKTFESALIPQSESNLYLQILRSGSYHDVRLRKRQRKNKISDADVIVVESDQARLNLTAKLLQFSDNVRPPYWGTWRKKSKVVSSRNPFAQDSIFDYEVDSDDEWDEGGPGESLSGSEHEDESGGEEDNYEEDNEFFVPHGYLSAEEEKDDDDEETEVDEDPEKRKKLLKEKLQEFELERKKKTTARKAIVLGLYIEKDQSCVENSHLQTALEPYAVEFLSENPIPTTFTIQKLQSESKSNSNASSPITSTSSAVKSKKACVPDDAMPHLVRLVHGNHHNLAFLMAEFQKFWQKHCLSQNSKDKTSSEKSEEKVEGTNSNAALNSPSTDILISKRQLALTVKQIASKRSVDSIKKPVWFVTEEIREKHSLMDLPITNSWTYLTKDIKDSDASPSTKPASKFSIEQFLAP